MRNGQFWRHEETIFICCVSIINVILSDSKDDCMANYEKGK
jgi:hypothetical protein